MNMTVHLHNDAAVGKLSDNFSAMATEIFLNSGKMVYTYLGTVVKRLKDPTSRVFLDINICEIAMRLCHSNFEKVCSFLI